MLGARVDRLCPGLCAHAHKSLLPHHSGPSPRAEPATPGPLSLLHTGTHDPWGQVALLSLSFFLPQSLTYSVSLSLPPRSTCSSVCLSPVHLLASVSCCLSIPLFHAVSGTCTLSTSHSLALSSFLLCLSLSCSRSLSVQTGRPGRMSKASKDCALFTCHPRAPAQHCLPSPCDCFPGRLDRALLQLL